MKKFNIEKSVFQKLVKNHSQYLNKYGASIFCGIKFELKDNMLEMASTDGNRLLVTQVMVDDAESDGAGIYDGLILSKIKFMKNMRYPKDAILQDDLQITLKENELNIVDLANSFYYNIPAIKGNYPKYEQLFPEIKENEYTTIGLNKEFFKDINGLCANDRTNIVEFSFKNNSTLSPVIATSKMSEIKSKVLLMPIQIR